MTFGPFSTEALSLINKIEPKVNDFSGDHWSNENMINRISLAIQRGNASFIMSTLPATTRLDQILYLKNLYINIKGVC